MPAPARLRIAIVCADIVEFSSRTQRIARALAADSHDVHVLAFAGPGSVERLDLGPRVQVTHLNVERRICSALRPLPLSLRNLVARAIGLDPEAEILPATQPRGLDRLRSPFRRLLELAGHVRRVGPWTDAVVAAVGSADVLQTQALPALPVVRAAARRVGARFVYDFADYQSEAGRVARLPWVLREFARRNERRLTRDAAAFLAVSEPVAALVARQFGGPRPTIVMNCSPAWRPDEPEPPASSRIHDALGLAAGRPLVAYQGQFKLDRGLEELVCVADHPVLAPFDPAFVFLGYGRLEPYLRDVARRLPGRVFVIPAVAADELLDWTAGAGVSYLGLPPRTLNQRLTLPNKVFESMMAGVPVIAADGTELARFVQRERIGRAADVDSPDALAAAIHGLLALPDDERAALRRHCRSVALSKYSWELQSRGLIDLYRGLAANGAVQPRAA